MLLDVAPRGTPEIRMISILVLSFCPVCHLLFVVHSRGNKFLLARRGRAVLRRKGFRARLSVLRSLHSFFRSPLMLIQEVAYWLVYSNRLRPGGTTRRIQDRKVSIRTATTFLQREPRCRRAALKLFKHDLEALKKKVFQWIRGKEHINAMTTRINQSKLTNWIRTNQATALRKQVNFHFPLSRSWVGISSS